MLRPDQPTASGVPAEVVFVSGPPFGPSMWDDVRRRLARPSRALAAAAFAPGTTPPPFAEPGPRVLVAHGLAVQRAVAWARATPTLGLVLTNGPVTRLDPATLALRALARHATPLARALLLPAPWTTWLASSAGLRRVVNNPYVMERDFVVAVAGGAVAEPGLRQGTLDLLRELDPSPTAILDLPVPIATIWGGGDPLYPTFEADFIHASRPESPRRDIPGGRWAHPIEQPWAFADALASLLEGWPTPG